MGFAACDPSPPDREDAETSSGEENATDAVDVSADSDVDEVSTDAGDADGTLVDIEMGDGGLQSTCDYRGKSKGVCENQALLEDGGCEAPSTFEEDEALCDGRDNDCDGDTDEACWQSVTASQFLSCGLSGAGIVKCRGANATGDAPGDSVRFRDLAAGSAHVCGATRSGTVECWGSDEYGEGEPTLQPSPTAYNELTNST